MAGACVGYSLGYILTRYLFGAWLEHVDRWQQRFTLFRSRAATWSFVLLLTPVPVVGAVLPFFAGALQLGLLRVCGWLGLAYAGYLLWWSLGGAA